MGTAFFLTPKLIMNNIERWNSYVKPSDEVDVEAVPGDLEIEIGGIAYLVQRKDDVNNVVCFRVCESDTTPMASFLMFRKWLLAQGITYIRVEGNPRRYNFLQHIDVPGLVVLKDISRTDRNIFFIKLQ